MFNRLKNNKGFILTPGLGALFGGLGGGALGALGSFFGRQKQPDYGYDIVQMPTYPWAEAGQQESSTYLRNLLAALSRGETPDWMKYLDPVQSGMKQNLYDQYYGSAGRPGILRDIQGAGAAAGIGPKASLAKTNQAFADYMTEGDKIDQYISSLKYNSMSNMALQTPLALAGLPRGPETQIVSMPGGAGQMSGQGGWGAALSNLAGNVPWEQMFAGFGGGGGTPQLPGIGANYGGLNTNFTLKQPVTTDTFAPGSDIRWSNPGYTLPPGYGQYGGR